MSSSSSVDYGYWESNAPKVRWPDYDEFLDFIELNNYPRVAGKDTQIPRIVKWSLDSAVSRIAERCGLDVRERTAVLTWQVQFTAGSTALLSPAAEFLTDRVGAELLGAYVSLGATLTAVADTSHATMSKVASYSGTGTVTVCPIDVSPAARAFVHPEVFEATLLFAARLYERRKSVTGTQGASELGGLIRFQGADADVEVLLANHLIIGLA